MDLYNDRFESSPQLGHGFSLSRPDDWRALLRTRANILVTGPNEAVKAFVRAAGPESRAPIRSVAGSRTLVLKTASTLILRDVDRLDRIAQRRLVEWMNEPGHAGTQILSTASTPLFPLVEAAMFDHGLYYWLNTICLEVQVPLFTKAEYVPSAPANRVNRAGGRPSD